MMKILMKFLPSDFECLKCFRELLWDDFEKKGDLVILRCNCSSSKNIEPDFFERVKKFGVFNSWLKWEMQQYGIVPTTVILNEIKVYS